MARKKQLSEVKVWVKKLVVVHDGASALRIGNNEQDIKLAIRILDEALMIAGLYDQGKDLINIEIALEEPECFVCGNDTTERGRHLLYCSPGCQYFARVIRHIRVLVDSGVPLNEGQIIGIGQQAYPWVSNGQGYYRYVPKATRLEVFARDEQTCQSCGAPATDIDHIEGGSAELENLQALCAKCNRQKMLSNLVPITDESKRQEIAIRIGRIAEYVANPIAPGKGFEHENWNDRRKFYSRQRKSRLNEQKFAAIRSFKSN